MNKKGFLVKLIDFGSSDYKKELHLRNEVLRVPLGRNLFGEDLGKEIDDYHFGIFSAEELIGTSILTPYKNFIKTRQVAILEKFRGQNAGNAIVKFAEEFAKTKGYERIELHARKTAISFYLRNGYYVVGPEFEEVSVPHYKMIKDLQ